MISPALPAGQNIEIAQPAISMFCIRYLAQGSIQTAGQQLCMIDRPGMSTFLHVLGIRSNIQLVYWFGREQCGTVICKVEAFAPCPIQSL